MDCRELETRLEALLDGELDELARRRCLRHLERCPSCRELIVPFGDAVAPPEDLLGDVLTATSGPPCHHAETLLCGWLDGELARTDRELLAAHLEACDGCRALAAAMDRLSAELPELKELRPDPGFVEAVLAATLPVSVRLRRWWAVVWPRWVGRPRFASEAAFIGMMVLALVFATPGSPLEAVPTRALELARTDPAARIEARLEGPASELRERLADRVGESLSAGYARSKTAAEPWIAGAATTAQAIVDPLANWIGTSREQLASLLGSADESASENGASENETEATKENQEKP